MTTCSRIRVGLAAFAASAALTALAAAGAPASSPPIGPLPAGPTAMIHTQPGQLVAMALPHRAGGKVWRIARGFDSRRLRQVSEADVGSTVVLVFEALRAGNATVSFGLTRGERAKAYESRQFLVTIT